ncbi:MAG: fumarate hydratase class I [Francisellaceae bacterium]|jgi:fumarate hydratase class I
MSIIKSQDLIQSIQDACQYISYYHPTDFIKAMTAAYEKEESEAAKNAMKQILINSRMSAMNHRPICQDTGMICVFVDIGMDVKWDTTKLTVQEMVDEGVRRAYADVDNPLRNSMVSPAEGKRKNTGDNTPAIVHTQLVHGNKVEVNLAAKGGGSEFKSKFKVLNPSDSVTDWICEMLPQMGAGWCPPGILGIGIGGTAEQSMKIAKESLNESIDMHELLERGPETHIEKLRVEIYHAVNNLGIGAQGLGGLTTVLDIKINDYPTHAACKPVAMIPNCAATRHVHFILDGSGAAELAPPSLDDWPEFTDTQDTGAIKINLNTITSDEIQSLKSGQRLLLNGTLLTGRDAAHKRIFEMVSHGEELPVDLKGKFIYYVGPVDPVGGEVVGPAGPTTATRMDKFTEFMLDEIGIVGMVGKSERGPSTIESIKKHKAIYLMAVGGAAYLISKSIRKAKVVAFEDLGMEAIYEFEVEDMPVTVAVDSKGTSVHTLGPQEWKIKILNKNKASL